VTLCCAVCKFLKVRSLCGQPGGKRIAKLHGGGCVRPN
jgi:hypothetical protein